MENKLCGECNLPINDLEPIRCGFCDLAFHIGQQCCGFNSRAYRDLFSQGKAMFLCPACKVELNGKCFHTYLNEKLVNAPAESTNAVTSEQFQQLVQTVGALIEKVDRLSSPQNGNDQISTVTMWPKLGVKRRRGDNGQAVRDSADRGTSTIDFTDLSIASLTPAPPPPRWWLYLSGFQPTITDADVTKVVARCLNINADDSVNVTRLVPKGADTSKLTFVSYKIGLDPQLKQSALTASSWPTGLLFREFIDMSKNRFGVSTMGQNPPVGV